MFDLVRLSSACPNWGTILVARPMPTADDPWGCLAPIKDTPWGKLVAEVQGSSLSHALYGRTKPLLEQIGPEPKDLLKMVPEPFRVCAQIDTCINANPKNCHPCAALPDCYDPPNLNQAAKDVARMVALAWRDGYYVVIPIGDEFSLG